MRALVQRVVAAAAPRPRCRCGLGIRGGWQHCGPPAADPISGAPCSARPRSSRGQSPWAAVMALKMVKGSIDRMFDKNLQDLVRGIRNHKEDEVSRR